MTVTLATLNFLAIAKDRSVCLSVRPTVTFVIPRLNGSRYRSICCTYDRPVVFLVSSAKFRSVSLGVHPERLC